ncbi:zinc finger protein 239 [Tachysurus ichikawai]
MNFVDNLNKWTSRVDMDYGNKLNQALSSSTKFLPTAGLRGAGPFQHYGRPLGHGVKVKEEDESVEDFFHFGESLRV